MPAAQGPIHVKKAGKAQKKPVPVPSIFGPLGNNVAPLKRAQRQAHAQTQRAQRRIPPAPRPSPSLPPRIIEPERARAKSTYPKHRTAAANREIQRRKLAFNPVLSPFGANSGLPIPSTKHAHPGWGVSAIQLPIASVAKEAANEIKGTGYLTGHAIPAAANALGSGLVSARHFAMSIPGLSSLSSNSQYSFGHTSDDAIKNVGKDIVEVPGEAVPSLYYALSPLASGNVGESARRFTQPYVDLVKHPGRSLTDHPVGSLLLLSGAKGAVGRGVGGVLRHSPSEGARALGSTRRAPAVAPDTTLAEPRSYSPDVITKAFQVRSENRAIRKADELNRRADLADEAGQAAKSRVLRRQAMAADPRIISDATGRGRRALRQRSNERQGVAEGLRRKNRQEIIDAVHKALGRDTMPLSGRVKRGFAVRHVAEGVTAASRHDIENYVGELATQHELMRVEGDRYGMAANEQLREQLTKAINDPKFDEQRLAAAADAYTKVRNPLDIELAHREILPAARSEKASLVSYAARNMPGARHEPAHYETYDRQPISMREVMDLRRSFGDDQVNSMIQHVPARWVDQHGQTLTSEAIRQHMAQARAGKAAVPAEVRTERTAVDTQAVGQATHRVKQLEEIAHEASLEVAAERHHVQEGQALLRRFQAEGKDISPIEWRHLDAVDRLKRKEADLMEASDRLKKARAQLKKVSTPTERRVYGAPSQDAIPGRPFVEDPAYISQSPNLRRSGQYFVNYSHGLPMISGKARTGKAVIQGLSDAHPDQLVGSAAKAQGLIDADQSWKEAVGEVAFRNEDGAIETAPRKADLEELARQLHESGHAMKWRPVRLQPLGGRSEQLREMIDNTAVEADHLDADVHHSFADALSRQADGEGPWALVPDTWAENQYQHERRLGGDALTRKVQKVNSVFRRTVLMTPHWLQGNTFEATLRGLIKGALPFVTPHYWRMRAILDGIMDPRVRAQVEEQLGAGQYGFAGRQHIVRRVEDLEGRGARAAESIKRTTGGHALTLAWDRTTHLVFDQVNGWIERQFRIALGGKAMKEQFFPEAMFHASHAAIEDAANGLYHTENQVRLGRYVDRAYGKYSKFGPGERSALVMYTPFAAWWINSIQFLFKVLPKDHPVLTSLVAAANQTSEDWRKAHGLFHFGKGQVPGFLQNSIPGQGDSHLRAFSQLTPFGVMADPFGTAAQQVLPQASGVLHAMQGQDFAGNPLRGKSKGQAVLEELAGSYLPVGSQYQRISGGSLRKFADPFMFTKGKASRSSSGAHPGWGVSTGKKQTGWGSSSSGSASSGWGVSP